jgi:hypothetical protein
MRALASRLAPVALLPLSFAVTPLSCSSFDTAAPSADAATDAVARSEASPTADAAPTPDATSTADATQVSDATPTADATLHAGSDAGLDPLYILPPPDAAACAPVDFGENADCTLGACLPVTPDGGAGLCQACNNQGGNCAGHTAAPCAAATDCSVDWLCYAGTCHASCKLGLPDTCGAQTCTSFGNDVMGVCL